MPKPTDQELENRFIYHPPKTDSRKAKHQKVTDMALALAKELAAENDGGAPTRCTSGGVGSGWHLDIDIDTTKTAETYRAELAAWMASRR